MLLQTQPVSKEPTVTWEALPPDFILPDDPAENIQQPALAAALTDALGAAGRRCGVCKISDTFCKQLMIVDATGFQS
jgi:hypothetical protein